MTRLALITALALCLAPPAPAEDKPPDGGDRPNSGPSLMQDGARLFLEGIQREMGPVLDEFLGMAEDMGPALRDFMRDMGPALADILDRVEDLSAYHPPEMLPNGDIILRRKTPPADPPADPGPGPGRDPDPGDSIEI